jgi:ADP-heptose:LPS heptosyltransferase
MALLGALGIKGGEDASITLGLPDWAQKKAQQLLDEIKVTGPFAMFHPGTMRPEKYWPPERWAEVIDYCRDEAGLSCIVTGSTDAYEHEHIAAIREKTKVYDLSGRTDLLTLAALASRASLLLSVDSMVMHMGAAFHTPQVALFGKTNAFHWRPRHSRAVSIQAGQAGINTGFSPTFRSEPMSEISTQAVIDAIRSLLNTDS